MDVSQRPPFSSLRRTMLAVAFRSPVCRRAGLQQAPGPQACRRRVWVGRPRRRPALESTRRRQLTAQRPLASATRSTLSDRSAATPLSDLLPTQPLGDPRSAPPSSHPSSMSPPSIYPVATRTLDPLLALPTPRFDPPLSKRSEAHLPQVPADPTRHNRSRRRRARRAGRSSRPSAGSAAGAGTLAAAAAAAASASATAASAATRRHTAATP